MTTTTAPSDTELLRQMRAGTAAAFDALSDYTVKVVMANVTRLLEKKAP